MHSVHFVLIGSLSALVRPVSSVSVSSADAGVTRPSPLAATHLLPV